MMESNITIQKIFEENLANNNGEGLVAPLGIKENGEIEYVDYSKINHLIVCGTSGSGKTTFVRTLLTSLMSISSPDSVKFGIFDSKVVDYTDINGMPFLLVPVVTDSRKSSGMICWFWSEAQRRLRILADDADNIDTLPDMFLVLDDYAEIVQEQDTQEYLYKLLQIARRVKIHVIIVTSIALAKIISTEIKIHIPHRISFFLPERRNSQVVIDQDGAETLEVPGQFIAKFYSKAKTFHAIALLDSEIQDFFDAAKSDEECDSPIYKQIFNKWGSQFIENETNYDEDVMDEIDRNSSFLNYKFNATGLGELDSDGDSMYDAAVEVVLEVGQASTSLLQRKLKLGYSRAERIINKMEENGVVGPHEGSKPRKVLIAKE